MCLAAEMCSTELFCVDFLMSRVAVGMALLDTMSSSHSKPVSHVSSSLRS